MERPMQPRRVSGGGSSSYGPEHASSSLHLQASATDADNDGAFEAPVPSLPSPIHTDTGESEALRLVRSVSDVTGAMGQNRSRAGTNASDDSLRSASSSVLERLRNSGNSAGDIGGNGGRISRTNSSELWKRRRNLKRQSPTCMGPCGDGSGDGSAVSVEPQDLSSFPDSVPSSASTSSSDEGRKQPQSGRRQSPISISTNNNGLPPAPPRSVRRTPTPTTQIARSGGSVARSRSTSPALLSSGPARLNRGVSLFEMKRRPSANMTTEDLRAIRDETEPIAFFSDTFDADADADEAEYMIRDEDELKPILPNASVAITKLTKVPYVHGAYSAVAPIFIRDARWMAILRKLMPESHAGVATLVKKNASKIDPLRLMKWAENNPVVAAYGALNSEGPRSHTGVVGESTTSPPPRPALEWDVFLDPSLVRSVDRAMQAAENLNKATAGKGGDTSFDDYNAQIAADVEVDRQMSRLMSRMMLAHGSTTQLVTEAVGMASKYNFARVVEQGESRRRKSKWGSILEPDCITSADELVENASADDASVSPSKAYEADIAKVGRGSKTISASGIFAERWLILFCQALKLGLDIASKDSKASRARLNALSPERSRSPLSESSQGSSSQSDEEEEFDGAGDDDQGSVDSFVVTADGNIADPLSMCGLFLCLGLEDSNARKADHSSSTMASSAKRIHKLLGAPLRVVLDLKSRKVPPRVWARLLDTLRTRGIAVDGIGSFDIDELRSIASFTCTPVSQVIFLHSAGDLQRACHAGEIKRGDTVFFNAGSLIWTRPTLCEATGLGLCVDSTSLNNVESQGNNVRLDPWNQNGLKMGAYSFQPFAYPREKLELLEDIVEECKATLEDYQRHLELNIGLYVQEFSIGDAALDAISKLVNHYPSIYNLGLAWGGLNGATVKGVHGDGYWNQRYIGREWDKTAEPAEHMTILAPEDHHLFQKAVHAGDWGQALTVNQIRINDEHRHRGLHLPPLCKTPGGPFAMPFQK